ncbi:MAG: Trk system potassium transporter TrkA [Proteobacteria bacterium]|nr:Trk system potassium transporter TrkA [Pseudomonadota bacterium]
MQIIIIGAGEVGYSIAEILSRENKDVVVIDADAARLKRVSDGLDIKTVCGSGSNPKVLSMAGLNQADMLIAVTDSDEVNMIACLIAGSQANIPVKIARIRNPEYAENTTILDKKHLNIDLAISPERAAADVILNILAVPHASSVAEFFEGKVKLFSLKVNSGCPVIGKLLKDLPFLHPGSNVLIPAICREGKIIIPRGNDLILEGDEVYTITASENVSRVISFFGFDADKGRRVMIAGGGRIGHYLAKKLEKQGISVKIVERCEAKCEEIAEDLKKTVVLNGDVSEQDLLTEENISNMDYFIAVTNDDEVNILSSILAKQMGAKTVITLVNKATYIPLTSQVGIDVALSPRLSTVSGILQYARRGKILSLTSIHEEDAEAIEVIALETSDIVNKPLKDIKEPKGAIIGAIEREGRVIIPKGEDVVLPGDRVLIFTLRASIKDVEKSLMVKMEFF